jgi:hypothetical protein
MSKDFLAPLIVLIFWIAYTAIASWIRGVPLYVYLFNLAVFLTLCITAWYIVTVKQINNYAIIFTLLIFSFLLAYDKDPFKDFISFLFFNVGFYATSFIISFWIWREKEKESSAQLSS